ncbi:hypothetical protein BKA07_003097 [Brevibacterium marinum]|uniref:Uncharacterized protein n=1 Tax=Brevibacterium marinum TaxID=418643 RepID=A0A846S9R9_9MICO|nr:hypothetical protein [Brevibacterium marinum]
MGGRVVPRQRPARTLLIGCRAEPPAAAADRDERSVGDGVGYAVELESLDRAREGCADFDA